LVANGMNIFACNRSRPENSLHSLNAYQEAHSETTIFLSPRFFQRSKVMKYIIIRYWWVFNWGSTSTLITEAIPPASPTTFHSTRACILYIKYLPLSFKQILITMPLLPPFNTKTISARGIHILDQILQLLHGCG